MCLAGLTFLGACQAGDDLFLLSDRSDAGDQQEIALGPVRPQDNTPALPQNQAPLNQAPLDHAATPTNSPPGPSQPATAANSPPPAHAAASTDSPPAPVSTVPAGPTHNPVQVAANDHPAEPPPQGDGGVAGQAGAAGAAGSQGPARQGSLAQAAGAAQPAENSDTRAVIEPGGGLFGSQFQRQMNSIRGGDRVRVNADTTIDPQTVIGNWDLSEEDGMRSCTIGFVAPENGNGAQATGGCSPVIGGIQSWGIFGDDLLLRDAQNSVVVRLRRSGEAWVGFTLQAGIPVILSRG